VAKATGKPAAVGHLRRRRPGGHRCQSVTGAVLTRSEQAGLDLERGHIEDAVDLFDINADNPASRKR
jgi:hypothetical protein